VADMDLEFFFWRLSQGKKNGNKPETRKLLAQNHDDNFKHRGRCGVMNGQCFYEPELVE